MHHHRVAQEKNKLINDLKRVKLHYETYEPLLKTMKDKYDGAIRDKVMNQLEKDRALAELNSIKKNEPSSPSNFFVIFNYKNIFKNIFKKYLKFFFYKEDKNEKNQGPTQKRLEEFRNYEKKIKEQGKKGKTEEEPFIINRHPKVKCNLKKMTIKQKLNFLFIHKG